MNFKQKLGYMFIGCLFTIAGYILASLGGDTTHAQSNEQVIDKIVCRELEVVNKEGISVFDIKAGEGGGVVRVKNSDGISVVNLEGKLSGEGLVHVSDKGGKSIIVMEPNVSRTGGVVEVYGKKAKGVARIGATEDGGFMVVGANARKDVVRIHVTEDGEGIIQTYKGGWRTH